LGEDCPEGSTVVFRRQRKCRGQNMAGAKLGTAAQGLVSKKNTRMKTKSEEESVSTNPLKNLETPAKRRKKLAEKATTVHRKCRREKSPTLGKLLSRSSVVRKRPKKRNRKCCKRKTRSRKGCEAKAAQNARDQSDEERQALRPPQKIDEIRAGDERDRKKRAAAAVEGLGKKAKIRGEPFNGPHKVRVASSNKKIKTLSEHRLLSRPQCWKLYARFEKKKEGTRPTINGKKRSRGRRGG